MSNLLTKLAKGEGAWDLTQAMRNRPQKDPMQYLQGNGEPSMTSQSPEALNAAIGQENNPIKDDPFQYLQGTGEPPMQPQSPAVLEAAVGQENSPLPPGPMSIPPLPPMDLDQALRGSKYIQRPPFISEPKAQPQTEAAGMSPILKYLLGAGAIGGLGYGGYKAYQHYNKPKEEEKTKKAAEVKEEKEKVKKPSKLKEYGLPAAGLATGLGMVAGAYHMTNKNAHCELYAHGFVKEAMAAGLSQKEALKLLVSME